MPTVIQIENLWKEYRLGVIGHGTLSRDLESWWAKIRGKEDPNSKIPTIELQETQIQGDRFWALRNINLKITEGEILGIIGKNGSGKSTLLKILSRVTTPTQGNIKIKGRIASLLEVGTGFHPELTGFDNIFLNGAILGMSKSEIQSKLDEIIDFSGVENFIQTPVKRYSSGMYVRLAFAVAAHLDPEILIIDEVLAVGDSEFQKKCLGKMEAVASEGRTVIFVSHNMSSVQNLCSRCVVLEGGQVIGSGTANEAISGYFHSNRKDIETELAKRFDRTGKNNVYFSKVELLNQEGTITKEYITGEAITFRIYYVCNSKEKLDCRFSVCVNNNETCLILLDSSVITGDTITISQEGCFDFKINQIPLSKGQYSIDLFAESQNGTEDWVNFVTELHIKDGDFFKSGKQYPSGWEGKTVLVKSTLTHSSN